MPNCKKIKITGTLPFNYYDDSGAAGYGKSSTTLCRMIAFVVSPTSFLTLKWEGEAESQKNEHGGKTAMYNFSISGVEAVSWKWADEFKKMVRYVDGHIDVSIIEDLE